jgi:hypothetical protein
MSVCRKLCVLFILFLGLGVAWGQDAPVPPAEGNPASGQPQQPAPAYGQENPAPAVSENPPISGLDLPNLEPHAAPLSYLQPGAHVSESVDSNIANSLGGSEVNSITRAEGSLELQRLWSHYDLSLDYLGGVGNYNVSGVGIRQIQELGIDQKVSWKRGELGVRDAFSYLPEGTFGSSYGSVSQNGAGLGGVGVFFGGSALGSLGQVPRILNLSLVDAVETLSPKSSITATAGYGFAHFLQNDPTSGAPLIGSSQITGELGYSRVLNAHDQVAVVYGYQGFNFSTNETFHSNVIQLMWGHRISGRMDFLAGVGPQFTEIDNELTVLGSLKLHTNDLIISAVGRARLRYQFPKSSLYASYEHYLTSGAGFFAGAKTDLAHVELNRPLSRVWNAFADVGYSHNTRVTPLPASCTSSSSSNCPGVDAATYQTAFIGVGLQRHFGRSFHAFASYQFNELVFDSSYCGVVQTASGPVSGPCNRISNREVGTIGLDWTPRPIRLD